jgi:hypothetical protein
MVVLVDVGHWRRTSDQPTSVHLNDLKAVGVVGVIGVNVGVVVGIVGVYHKYSRID